MSPGNVQMFQKKNSMKFPGFIPWEGSHTWTCFYMVYNCGPLSPVPWKSHFSFSVVSLGGLVLQQEGSLARAVPHTPHRMGQTGDREQRGCVAEEGGVVTMVQGETATSGSTEHGHKEWLCPLCDCSCCSGIAWSFHPMFLVSLQVESGLVES